MMADEYGVDQEQAATPPPAIEPPAPETEEQSPFAGMHAPELTAATPSLGERFGLHITNARVRTSILGAVRDFGDSAIQRAARERGQVAELENEAISRAVKTRDELAEFDRMPGSEGFLDYGAAVIGSLIGAATSPESMVGNVVKLPVLAARGAWGRMAEFGVNQALVNTATDPIVQGLNIKSGASDHFDWAQTAMAAPAGFMIGGAFRGAHETARLFVTPQIEKDALTFLKAVRDFGGPDEQARWPEFVDIVKGKSDAELGDIAREIRLADVEAQTRPATETAEADQTTIKEAAGPKATPSYEPAVQIDGKVYTGGSHADALERAAQRLGTSVDDLLARHGGEQGVFDGLDGFVGRDGEFVTRKEAYAAVEAEAPTEAIGDRLVAEFRANEGEPAVLGMAMTAHEGSLGRPVALPGATTAVGTGTANVEAPNIRAMWMRLADALDATVRQGRMVNKKASGEFGTESGVIRMKQIDDPVVMAHEIGHHIEYTIADQPLKDAIAAHGELDFLTAYAAGHADPAVRRSEGFAEYIRLFAENPSEAASRAPNFDREFRAWLDGQPKMKGALERIQKDFEAYRTANASDLVDANVHSSKVPSGWEKIKQDVRENGFWNTIAERGSQRYTGMVDEKNPLANTVRELLRMQKGNTGKIIELIAANDPYKLIRLASNAHQGGMVDLMHGVVPYRGVDPDSPSLFDAIALATGKPNIFSGWDEAAVQSFDGYLTARRGVFEWERRAAGLLDRDPMPFSKDVYEAKIAEYERRNPNAAQAADMVHSWTRALLKKEYEAGLITSDSYNAALQIRDYVPLMRDMSDRGIEGGAGGAGGGFDAGQVGLRRFGGSSRPIISPLESLMERSFRTAQLIAHNDALKALASLADKAGIGAGKLVERVPAHEIKANYVDPLEALRQAGKGAGMSKVDIDLMVSNLANELSVNGQPIGPVSIFRSEQAKARGENLVFYLEGGDLKALRLTEGDFGRQLVDIMTGGLSSPLQDWNLQWLHQISKVLRLGVTTSPEFFIANTVRDQLGAWILNRGTLPFLDAMRGIYREATNSDLARIYSQTGGIAGGANVSSLDKALVNNDLQALAKKGFVVSRFTSWEAVFKTVELSETGTRLGIFERAYEKGKKQGLSDYEAAVEATFAGTDYLDFGRHGSRMGDTLKLVPFFNAGVQGLDKAGRALFSPLFREALTTGDVEARKTAISAWAKIGALTGLSMALRAAYIGDPEYDEISDYLRNTHWMIKVPGIKSGKVINALGQEVEVPAGARGLWIAIPKPFELAIIPNLGERAVEMLNYQDPKALTKWAAGALDLVTPRNVMESVGVKLYGELKSGKDFYSGRDIVPDYLKGLEPWMRATASTSEFSKTLASSLNKVQRSIGGLIGEGGVSPMMIDHFIKGTAGGWGRNLLSLTDQAAGTKGEKSLADTAITMRFFKEAYRGSTSVQDFWNQIGTSTGKLTQAAKSYDEFLKAGKPTEASAFAARLSDDKRVFVVLDKSPLDETREGLQKLNRDKLFSASELNGNSVVRRAHPLARAELASRTISQMQKEIAGGYLTGAADQEPIKLTGSEQRVALDILSRIRMWEARNALVVTEAEGMKGKSLGNVGAEMDMLKGVAPRVYDELAQRYANAKVYRFDAVKDAWPALKREVLDYGSDADLSEVVRSIRRDGYELEGERDKAKRTRPKIRGRLSEPEPAASP